LSLIGIVFLFTRLWELTLIPVSNDEAMYLYFSKIITSSPSELFISKVDSKQPLFMWLISIAFNWFSDPLFAGRFVSVLAGLGTLIGVYKLTDILYSTRAALMASVIYICCPYNLFHERMIFLESLLSCLGVWIFIFSIQIARAEKNEAKQFAFLGASMGFAFLTKATAVLLFPVPIFIFLIYKSYKKENFFRLFILALSICACISSSYFLATQQLGFSKSHIFLNNPLYFHGVAELINLPWHQWKTNLWLLAEFYIYYLTAPIIFVLALSVWSSFKNKRKEEICLWFWAVIPPLVIVTIAKIFFSRYFLIFIPPLIILAGNALEKLGKRLSFMMNARMNRSKESLREGVVGFLLLTLISMEGLSFSMSLIKNPMKATMPKIDRYQYLESIISGHGIAEGIEFLREKSKSLPIQLFISTFRGNPQDGFSVYLWDDTRIRMIPAPWWPENPKLFPQEEKFPVLTSKYQGSTSTFEKTDALNNVYFIYPHTTYQKEEFYLNNPQWKKVWQFLKPDRKSHVEIYKYEEPR